jgi:hypothetical protein
MKKVFFGSLLVLLIVAKGVWGSPGSAGSPHSEITLTSFSQNLLNLGSLAEWKAALGTTGGSTNGIQQAGGSGTNTFLETTTLHSPTLTGTITGLGSAALSNAAVFIGSSNGKATNTAFLARGGQVAVTAGDGSGALLVQNTSVLSDPGYVGISISPSLIGFNTTNGLIEDTIGTDQTTGSMVIRGDTIDADNPQIQIGFFDGGNILLCPAAVTGGAVIVTNYPGASWPQLPALYTYGGSREWSGGTTNSTTQGFTGNGANLTGLNGAAISSGNIPLAAITNALTPTGAHIQIQLRGGMAVLGTNAANNIVIGALRGTNGIFVYITNILTSPAFSGPSPTVYFTNGTPGDGGSLYLHTTNGPYLFDLRGGVGSGYGGTNMVATTNGIELVDFEFTDNPTNVAFQSSGRMGPIGTTNPWAP